MAMFSIIFVISKMLAETSVYIALTRNIENSNSVRLSVCSPVSLSVTFRYQMKMSNSFTIW